MSTYTSATDADRRAMLDAIGAMSIEELFADIPGALRLDRPLALPAGMAEQEVYEHLKELASRNVSAEDEVVLPRRRDVRPLRAVADRHAAFALGVPDAVHALPAGDLAGRAAGDVRVPDGDQRADRAAGLERVGLRGAERGRRRRLPREAGERASARARLARRAPALRETLDDARARLRADGRGGAAARRRDRPRRAGRGARRRRLRGRAAAAELPRLGRGRRGAHRGGEGRRRGRRLRLRPDPARDPASRPARRASTSPSARARRSATGSTTAARRSASSPPRRSTCAACPAASQARPSTSTASAASC